MPIQQNINLTSFFKKNNTSDLKNINIEYELLRIIALRSKSYRTSIMLYSVIIIFFILLSFESLNIPHIVSLSLWFLLIISWSLFHRKLCSSYLNIDNNKPVKIVTWRRKFIANFSLLSFIWAGVGFIILGFGQTDSLLLYAIIILAFNMALAVLYARHFYVFLSSALVLGTVAEACLILGQTPTSLTMAFALPFFILFSIMLGGDRHVCMTTTLRANADLQHSRLKSLEANRSKSSFLAMMSHELRTPLNAIIGFSDMIHSEIYGKLSNEKYKNYLHHILDSSHHLLALVDEILDMSRMEIGSVELEQTVFSPCIAAQSAINWLGDQANRQGIRLIFQDDARDIIFKGDLSRFKQIILNLVSNGIKYSKAGDSVKIKIEHLQNNGLCLTIIDTGVGIPSEMLNKIFEPFVRIKNGPKYNETDGVGLGLAITKKLVELHEGTIQIESTPDVGTKFKVTFPSHRIRKQENTSQKACLQHETAAEYV